ncbi:MAG: hypothetical protein WAU28_00770 [Candidatus Moraniibacteriota bacterium]
MVTKKKQKSAPHTFWWQSLFNLVAQGILSDAKAFIQSAEDQFKEFIQITIVRSLLLLSGFIGYIFILIGVSSVMDSFFRFPGAGSLFVGSLTLLLSFIVFSLVGSQKKK